MHLQPARWLLTALLVALATAIAACGGETESGGDVAQNDFQPTTEAPSDAQEGGTLEVIAAGDVDYIDPGAMYYQFSYLVGYAIHRPLYSWQPADVEQASPDLAEGEAEISDDDQTITITIRDGVEFGPPVEREVTTADVKYAIERGLLPGVANGYIEAYMGDLEGFEEAQKAAANAKAAPDIKGIETPDDRTIVFNLDKPTASTFVQSLSLPLTAPVPEEYAKEFDAVAPSEYGMNQVATGPYMIENDESGELTGYSPGKEISMVRNPNWDPATDYRPAYLDEIQVTEGFTDLTSASRKILQGESQVSGDFAAPPPQVLKEAATEFPEQLSLTPSGGNRYIALNTQIPPFDDIDVRKAVLAAADREALRLTRGGELIGPIATHFIPPEIPGYEEAGGAEGPGLDFLADPNGDPELAAQYMRDAGFESGKYEGNEEILMVGDDTGVGRKTAEVTLELLESLGFEVDFQPVTHDAMYTKFCNVPAEEVHVCPNVGWLKDFNDPQTILDPTFNGENILPENNSNWPQLDVPEINKAMEEAKTINDPEERAQAWGEIDNMITEQAPAIPWVWDYGANLRSENVNGVVNKFNSSWDLNFTSIDQG
jgi:peptide/nickel transport system substrate-binding protein